MVDIAPFKAFRKTHPKGKNDISDFICPPYDVISPDQRAALINKSSDNVVQLELPAGDDDMKYLQAARILRDWFDQDLIQQDRRASFYLLETTYRIKDAFAPKSAMKRYGVLTGLRLEAPGKGRIKPHEKTLSKAKEDRLKLLTSIRMNISPIFGLFFDKKNAWSKWISKIIKMTPIAKGRESKDLSHRLWKIDQAGLIKELQKMVKAQDLYIADGHHRYEVAWAYRTACQNHPEGADPRKGWNHVMTYVCPMEEKGLLMLPTHRFVQTKKNFQQWKDHLAPIFDILKVADKTALVLALNKAAKEDRVIGWIHSTGFYVLKFKKNISIDRCLENRPAALRSLDVVLLHDLILDESRGAVFTKDTNIYYTQDIDSMYQKAKKNPFWCGFVLRSAGVDSLARVAGAGEVMPPKTTYFYPKAPTGFTLLPLNKKLY